MQLTDTHPAADTAARPKPSLRPVVLLSIAAFAAAATMRVADPMLPQVAYDFGTTPGTASIVVTAFSLSYGLLQVVYGPLGDRVGKYRVIAAAMVAAGISVGLGAFATSLGALAALRLLSGATAAAVIPLAMAYIGDIVAYENRQAVLARFLTGQISGLIFGQAFGGAAIDFMSWRAVLLILAAIYLSVAVLLALELRSGRVVHVRPARPLGLGGAMRQYLALMASRLPRTVLIAVAVEGFLFFGSFAYVGAYIHHVFGLRFVAVGALLGCFGLGGLLYTLSVKRIVAALGERGMVRVGGVILAVAFAALAFDASVWMIGPIITVIGFGFYMLHNTLQTNATQMAPDARGASVSLFAFWFFLSQAAGVALAGIVVDRFGYVPVLAGAGLGLALLGFWFARARYRPAPTA